MKVCVSANWWSAKGTENVKVNDTIAILLEDGEDETASQTMLDSAPPGCRPHLPSKRLAPMHLHRSSHTGAKLF